MFDFFPWELAVPVFAIFIASFMQSITGFGLAIIATPLLLLSYEAKLAVIIMQCVAVCANLIQSIQLFRSAHWQLVLYMGIGALIGQPIGLFVYGSVSNTTLKLIVSICILLSLALMKFHNVKIPESKRNSLITGFFSGVLATTTGMNGPPLVLYLAYTNQKPIVIRATCVVYFCLSNMAALIGFALHGQPLAYAADQALYLLPGLAVGLFLGSFAFNRVSSAHFRQILFGMLFLSCIYTIYSVLF